VQRHPVHHVRWPDPGRPGAVEQGGGLPAAGQPVARGGGRALPQLRLDPDEPAGHGRAAPLQVPPGAADLGRDHRIAAGRGGRPVRGGAAAMRLDPAHLEHARKVADAVLYEGYLLYPYRRSAQKNRTRFQFGVLMPPPYRAVDEHEPSASRTECLVECPPEAEIDIGLRFLHLQRRTAQRIDPGSGAASDTDTLSVDGTEYGSFDEAVEREQHLHGLVADLLDVDTELRFEVNQAERAEELTGQDGAPAGRLIRRCEALAGAIVARAE